MAHVVTFFASNRHPHPPRCRRHQAKQAARPANGGSLKDDVQKFVDQYTKKVTGNADDSSE